MGLTGNGIGHPYSCTSFDTSSLYVFLSLSFSLSLRERPVCQGEDICSHELHVPVVLSASPGGPLLLAVSVRLVDGFGLGFCWTVVRAVLEIAANVPMSFAMRHDSLLPWLAYSNIPTLHVRLAVICHGTASSDWHRFVLFAVVSLGTYGFPPTVHGKMMGEVVLPASTGRCPARDGYSWVALT